MKKTRIYEIFKEHLIAVIIIAIIGGIYTFNMFTNGPWYDELYTYYYFISRGPIYAAIHWPVPNNHVGYSVLSAFLDFFGNPYIGLRGLSVICGITNLALIYNLCLKFMNKYYSVAAMALYASAYLPFRLAFQGRGYTLAVSCLLIATLTVYKLSLGDCRRKYYIAFACALTLGLYTVPSSIYWVIPICVTGGLFLLLKKRYRDLFSLIFSGVFAAIATFFLYLLIWLAIGANLLSKDSSSAFYGISQVKIILKAPFSAAGTGIEYMLASPYIQSIDRIDCIKTLPEYFISLLGQYYAGAGIALLIMAIAVFVVSTILIIKSQRKGGTVFLSLFVACGLLIVPIMLIIQSVHPYLRVLSFYAIYLFVGIIYLLSLGLDKFNKSKEKAAPSLVLLGLSLVLSLSFCFGSYYNAPVAERENEIRAALNAMPDPITNESVIFYTDDFQKYVLKFYYDVTPVEVYVMEDADYVITGPEFFDENNATPEWPVLYGYSEGFTGYISDNMNVVAQTDSFTIYQK